jgi:uncharacterized membrane protein
MCGAMMAALGGQAAYSTALLLGTVAAVLLVAVVGLGFLRRQPERPTLHTGEHPAVGILKDRLARGEIDADEFEQRLLTLMMYEPPR